jgi:hypothetical protein
MPSKPTSPSTSSTLHDGDPRLGSVVVRTSPLSVTATQNAVEGQEVAVI